MPWMTKDGKRDYEKQGRLQDAKPAARKARADGVKIQRALEKAGRAKKGDGKDNAHIVAFSKGGKPTLSNVKLQDPSANRSFARNSDSSLKHEKSKKGK